MAGTVLDPKKAAVNKTDKTLHPLSLHPNEELQTNQQARHMYVYARVNKCKGEK